MLFFTFLWSLSYVSDPGEDLKLKGSLPIPCPRSISVTCKSSPTNLVFPVYVDHEVCKSTAAVFSEDGELLKKSSWSKCRFCMIPYLKKVLFFPRFHSSICLSPWFIFFLSVLTKIWTFWQLSASVIECCTSSGLFQIADLFQKKTKKFKLLFYFKNVILND